MSITPERRRLKFQDLQDAVREAEALHAGGYRRLGKWDLSQACGHLADWLTFPVDGFPKIPFYFRPTMFLVRNMIAPAMLRKTLATGEMPGGAPTMPATVPTPGGDEAKALARFRRAVERFQAHKGPYHPSPMFGQTSREDTTRIHLIHCAHHLGYLVSNASD